MRADEMGIGGTLKKGVELMADKGGRRAVFLDRDGCINAMVYHAEFGLVDSPQNPAEFRLLEGVAEAIRLLHELGFLAVVVSNQPGIAKGKCTAQLVEAITAQMQRELAAGGAQLDGIYYCLHHPEAELDEYRLACDCRKPKPGLLLRAAAELGIDLRVSHMIGDGLTDVLAGRAAGCHTILLGRERCDLCRVMEELDARPDDYAPQLLAAARLIEAVSRRTAP
jgi:D-glycero-D-manno-heptose 1,7-bisphosphate phosphatase